jgi:diaminopimelate epimerase
VFFAKAHGLGNDFLLVADELVPSDVATWARLLCDRHRGVGEDGVLRYRIADGAAHMRLINADGGEVELSGNGVRCLAGFVHDKGWLPAAHVVMTPAGPRPVVVSRRGPKRFSIRTELGAPGLRSDQVPVALTPAREPVLDLPLTAGGAELRVTATSMGNPHCAVFFDSVADDAQVARLGPALETHALFPARTNVEFVTVTNRAELRVRFWERGVGPTQSSGTGSASAFVAAVLKGLVDRSARVVCDGGVLELEWPEGGGVRQTGDVELTFEGEWWFEGNAR